MNRACGREIFIELASDKKGSFYDIDSDFRFCSVPAFLLSKQDENIYSPPDKNIKLMVTPIVTPPNDSTQDDPSSFPSS